MRAPLYSAQPPAQGLYDPQNEHDACGVAFVATLTGVPSHEIVLQGLTALRNLDHRGAVGGDPDTGDGAGIMIQVPDAFLRGVSGVELPEAGTYAAGMAFLPTDEAEAAEARARFEEIATEEGLTVLGWRDVPIEPEVLGHGMSRAAMPAFVQVFVDRGG